MAKAEFIGYMRCPLCSSEKARVSLSKSQLCCITCHACQFQGFARSDHSDMHVRRQLRAVEPNTAPTVAAQVPTVTPPAPAPVAAPKAAPKVAKPAAPAPAPKPEAEAATGNGWNIW